MLFIKKPAYSTFSPSTKPHVQIVTFGFHFSVFDFEPLHLHVISLDEGIYDSES